MFNQLRNQGQFEGVNVCSFSTVAILVLQLVCRNDINAATTQPPGQLQ